MAHLLKSVFAGSVGGLLRALVMKQFDALVGAASTPDSKGKAASRQTDDATGRAAEASTKSPLDRQRTPQKQLWDGLAVHYGLGTLLAPS